MILKTLFLPEIYKPISAGGKLNAKKMLELQIRKNADIQNTLDIFLDPLNRYLGDSGSAFLVMPIHKGEDGKENALQEIELGRETLYLQYFRIWINLNDFPTGVKKIKDFLEDGDWLDDSTLIFQPRRYNLLDFF